jgi:hypothetical protein
MVVVVVSVVFLVGLYFAGGWLVGTSPAIAEWLRPLLQTLRDWVNTVLPTVNQLLNPPPTGY